MPKSVLMSYRPMQRREMYTFLQGLCETPERVNDHIKRYAVTPSKIQRSLNKAPLQLVRLTCLRYGVRT